MTVLVLILSLIIIALFVIIVSYRRQVKTICRHVSFIKDNHTNMNLYEKLPFRELNELIENINSKTIMIYIFNENTLTKLKAIVGINKSIKDKLKLDSHIKIKENIYDTDIELEFTIKDCDKR